jgi:hypothetical protein
MSLLGKLFSGLPAHGHGSSGRSSNNPLDSNLEDQFTHNLLFPDAEALCHHDQVFSLSSGTVLAPAPINAFDVHNDLDLELRDVRVIIMQEATTATGSAYLLFDSHPAPPSSPSLERQPSVYSTRSEGRRSISSPRRTSLGQNSRPVIIQQEPAPRPFGAFDRRSTTQSQGKAFGYNETEGQRSAREYREEVSSFSNCIFGASDTLAYKGAGTKLHILPAESRAASISGSYAGDGSLGRSSLRTSKLAQSFTSDGVGSGLPSASFPHAGPPPRVSDKKKVLITRIFPVPLPNEEQDDADGSQKRTPTARTPADDASGYPFPNLGENGAPQKKKPQQNRTPMYAVGLVVQLPAASHAPYTPVSRSSFRGPGSYTEHDSFPSSFNSARHAGWTVLSHGPGPHSLEPPFSGDADDRIDIITQHWDIIMRTLSHLQLVATATLLPMLKQANISSPSPPKHVRTSSASISIGGKRVEDVKPFKVQKPTIKYVQLTANCLVPVEKIHKVVDASRQRILSGLKASQVVTGQGRWGIWREEARLVAKWAGGKDEGFFFFNVLTAFLGNHTDWLQALGPSWYRRRHYQQQRGGKDDELSLPARTIVVSDNKLMARRLIFLLSAFLPANQQRSSRFHRPGTATSFGGSAHSPPTYVVPILREESLRRRINKRGSIVRGSHARTMSFPAQGPQGPEIHHHDRRISDASSIKTANLPIPGSDIGTRNSSAATTSTLTPVTTMPHFSTRRPVRGTGPAPSPGSSGSLATEDLIRSLKRDESTGHYSTASSDSHGHGSRWGSMISGFWGSSRRRESTVATSPPRAEGLEINEPHHRQLNGNKLQEMVDEASGKPHTKPPRRDGEVRESDSGSAKTAKQELEVGGDDVTEQTVHVHERTPDPSGAYESPVKTSIKDGIIDIDVPLPEYLSFETAVSSPSSSGYSMSTPGFGNGMDGFEHYGRPGLDTDSMNVAGWLPRYHPDFTLQAITPHEGLLEDIKESMRNEPTPVTASTPHPDGSGEGRWVNISSAIIADTTNFSIKHISYSRFIKPANVEQATPSSFAPGSLDSKYGNVYSTALLTPSLSVQENKFEERFVEKSIISMDETLIEAVERIMAQSGPCSNGSSVSSSRSTSRKGRPEGRDRSNSEARDTSVPEHRLEVPRNECKKTVLTALEEIVRSVVESREREEAEQVPPNERELAREKESFLREGVRTWLESVEGYV